MAFSYYTVYRTEGAQPNYPRLTGAARFPEAEPGANAWIFWVAYGEGFPYRVLEFEKLRKASGGEVVGTFPGGGEVRFVPLTADFVREHPERYGLTGADLSDFSQGDVYNLFHSLEVGDDYEEWVGPRAEALTYEDEQALDEDERRDLMLESLFFELRGVPAPVGARHKWKDGYYRKQPDHSWRKEPASYSSETHPDVPESTADKYWDKQKKMWSPERKKLHKKVLDEVRGVVFAHAKPVPPDQRPVFTYMMGPPASGKTTDRVENQFHNAAKLDPDQFVVRMPEFQRAVRLKVRSGAKSVAKECMQLNDVLVDEAVEKRFNFVIEGSGGDPEWMINTFFPRLKKAGYSINIVAAYVEDLDELLLRSEERGERCGRFVPPERIEALHSALPATFRRFADDPDVDTVALMNTHYEERPRDPQGKPPPRFQQVFVQARTNGQVAARKVSDEGFYGRMMTAATAYDAAKSKKAAEK